MLLTHEIIKTLYDTNVRNSQGKYALENITITPLVNELDQCGNMLN